MAYRSVYTMSKYRHTPAILHSSDALISAYSIILGIMLIICLVARFLQNKSRVTYMRAFGVKRGLTFLGREKLEELTRIIDMRTFRVFNELFGHVYNVLRGTYNRTTVIMFDYYLDENVGHPKNRYTCVLFKYATEGIPDFTIGPKRKSKKLFKLHRDDRRFVSHNKSFNKDFTIVAQQEVGSKLKLKPELLLYMSKNARNFYIEKKGRTLLVYTQKVNSKTENFKVFLDKSEQILKMI